MSCGELFTLVACRSAKDGKKESRGITAISDVRCTIVSVLTDMRYTEMHLLYSPLYALQARRADSCRAKSMNIFPTGAIPFATAPLVVFSIELHADIYESVRSCTKNSLHHRQRRIGIRSTTALAQSLDKAAHLRLRTLRSPLTL